ncbi:hypothetical protein [Oceaniradius stylonematis]|nr:hypothetical protein [Oceaniradius stylonematis]
MIDDIDLFHEERLATVEPDKPSAATDRVKANARRAMLRFTVK